MLEGRGGGGGLCLRDICIATCDDLCIAVKWFVSRVSVFLIIANVWLMFLDNHPLNHL